MLDYETGVIVALLLWLFQSINLLIAINSTLERNLNRIGKRHSWLTLAPTELESSDLSRTTIAKIFRFLLIISMGFPFVLLSWLFVALSAGKFAYFKFKDAGAPQSVREFRWKMKNIDMAFDQIIRETMKISDQDPANFEKVRDDLISELEEQELRNKKY